MLKDSNKESKDQLGQSIYQGDCVAFCHQNHLIIGIVKRINPVMLRVEKLGKKQRWGPDAYNKYPSQCVKLNGPHVSMYLIKISGEP